VDSEMWKVMSESWPARANHVSTASSRSASTPTGGARAALPFDQPDAGVLRTELRRRMARGLLFC
jgi:hypothetical protein